jgi:hypothetical protein
VEPDGGGGDFCGIRIVVGREGHDGMHTLLPARCCQSNSNLSQKTSETCAYGFSRVLFANVTMP